MRRPIANICIMHSASTVFKEMGGDAKALFQQLGLDISTLDSPDATISLRDYTSLLNLAAEELQDPHFGLQMGQRADVRKYGAFGLRLYYSKTIGEGIAFVSSFTRCIQQATLARVRSLGHTNLLTLDFLDADGQDLSLVTEAQLAFYVRWIRQTHRSGWDPLKVYLRRPQPQNINRLKQYFRAPILFDHEFDGLEFTNGTARTPLTNHDPDLCQILEDHLTKQSGKWPQWHNLKSVVTAEIKQGLEANTVQIEKVSEQLGYSTRTLQRRLKSQGIEYSGLVEDVRCCSALTMLEQGNKSISDISFSLGYADVSSFSRAFQRWQGISPNQHRKAAG